MEHEHDEQIHFDVAATPAHLQADDGPDQSITLTAALCPDAAVQRQADRFYSQPKGEVKLDALAKLYCQSKEQNALQLLTRRHEITISGSQYVERHDEPTLAWEVPSHFLDLQICVGRGLGLAAMIPNVGIHHAIEFSLDLHNRTRQFNAKYAKLGFDPKKCMLWIGRSSSGEDTWLAWVPTDNLGPTAEDVPPATGKEDTVMSQEHYRIAVMFLSSMLACMNHRGITVTDNYPDLTSDNAFRLATNALDQHRRIILNLAAMKQLDNRITSLYHDWVNDAPREYIEDNFFRTRVPIAITSRFGQNQRLAQSQEEEEEETSNWKRDRDYKRIRYITFAAATHIRARAVLAWIPLLTEQIMDELPEGTEGVYSSADPTTRQFITWDELDNMDLYDEAGQEIHIHCHRGFIVPRRVADFDTPPHGILMDLRVVKELFRYVPNGDDMLVDEEPAVDIYTYPQAGLKVAGHFQANGIMTPFLPFLQEVNDNLGNNSHEEEDDEDEEHTPPLRKRIVYGIACQGYNAVMHCTRGDSAQHHDAQMGLITGTLAGSWASSRSTERTARNLRLRCQNRLPHASFSDKIENREISRDLRLENVFYIDVEAMHKDDQKGETIIQQVIHALVFAWNHPSILEEIKSRVVIFKPEAYPMLYNWTTYPLTRLLRRVWRVGQAAFTRNEKPCPTLVELCSALERALNFMHTGNVAVIATSAMNPLWIGLSIIHDGHPCLNPSIVPSVMGSTFVNVLQWPLNENRMPKSASRCAQIRTYGEGHYNTFFAHLAMATINPQLLPTIFRGRNEQDSIAHAIAYHALSLLVQDCRSLVSTAVQSSINEQINSDEQVVSSHGKARKQALSCWLKTSKPLAWTADDSVQTGGYVQLLFILNDNPHRRPTDLQKSNESFNYLTMSKRFLSISALPRPCAPISNGGAFRHVLPLAITRIRHIICKEDDPNFELAVAAIFAKMLKLMQIHFVPWHKADKEASRAYAVRHDWWLILDSCPMTQINRMLPPEPQEVQEELADFVMQADPNAPWSLPKKLMDMGALWDKYTLPSDWSLEHASLPQTDADDLERHYVRATYEFVEINYNGRCWWHHMALVWGILFSRVAPHVFWSRKEKLASGDATQAIRGLAWTKGTSKYHGGCSAPLPYITMLSTTIIALLDPKSPLSIRVAENDNAFGKPWTHKHGNKEINAINLIRIGIAKCINKACMGSAKYKRNFEMKTMGELKPLYDQIMGYLKSGEHGVFLALKALFGEMVAIRIAMQGEINMPDFVANKAIQAVVAYDTAPPGS
ncbi:hypothetical protein M378DRAFT_17747 [Amanita muscaria Koide BX008]|uniref:DUF8190 domain-containing protein n=1 Tax=Amanita muscaria (strain Koide BX008) TaxID=946122 RepID=A0A0C2W3I8_AMAMK|nr:hypothetical protein M378DRAFT_17747 [Amanita muscaria Koide BX008]